MKNKRYGGRIQVKRSFIRRKLNDSALEPNYTPIPTTSVPLEQEPVVPEQPLNQEPISEEEMNDIFLGYSTRRGGKKTKKNNKSKKNKSKKNKSKRYRK
jgi:hypothetical protein